MDNLKRQNVSSGSPYEPLIGISRASRIGSFIAVSGTAPIGPDSKTVGVGDPKMQARRCIEIIREALRKAGADLNDVIRTRLFLTRIDDWKVIAEVHGEYFKDIRPACTILEVSRFVNPEWLVEIEADAVAENEG
jgi:enamine deaminase RidA (YjgF/YER057c/UK114 family)